MFIRVIEGHGDDREALRRIADRWGTNVRGVVPGCVGATMGCADDGTFLAILRFESTDAAAEQATLPSSIRWIDELTAALLSPPQIEDHPEVDVFAGGGSAEAGFVQVVRGRALDKTELKEIEWQILEWFPGLRPDYFGSWMAWNESRFTEVAYFASAAEAHAGEQRVAESEHSGDFEQWLDGITDVRYVDLHEPWHYQ